MAETERLSQKKASSSGAVGLTETELNDVHGGKDLRTQRRSTETTASLKGGGTMTVKVEKSEFK